MEAHISLKRLETCRKIQIADIDYCNLYNFNQIHLIISQFKNNDSYNAISIYSVAVFLNQGVSENYLRRCLNSRFLKKKKSLGCGGNFLEKNIIGEENFLLFQKRINRITV